MGIRLKKENYYYDGERYIPREELSENAPEDIIPVAEIYPQIKNGEELYPQRADIEVTEDEAAASEDDIGTERSIPGAQAVYVLVPVIIILFSIIGAFVLNEVRSALPAPDYLTATDYSDYMFFEVGEADYSHLWGNDYSFDGINNIEFNDGYADLEILPSSDDRIHMTLYHDGGKTVGYTYEWGDGNLKVNYEQGERDLRSLVENAESVVGKMVFVKAGTLSHKAAKLYIPNGYEGGVTINTNGKVIYTADGGNIVFNCTSVNLSHCSAVSVDVNAEDLIAKNTLVKGNITAECDSTIVITDISAGGVIDLKSDHDVCFENITCGGDIHAISRNGDIRALINGNESENYVLIHDSEKSSYPSRKDTEVRLIELNAMYGTAEIEFSENITEEIDTEDEQ